MVITQVHYRSIIRAKNVTVHIIAKFNKLKI